MKYIPGISSIGQVPIEVLPGNRHITWILAVLLFTTNFLMEPLPPNAFYYCTSQEAVLDCIHRARGYIWNSAMKTNTAEPPESDAFPTELQSEPFRVKIWFNLCVHKNAVKRNLNLIPFCSRCYMRNELNMRLILFSIELFVKSE